ncbi:hypothetical protein RYX56_05700 [Alkalihalophilus lindianensis]|uniref:DUF3168 domain-containing protein n=1 Tax=Alkalihalophilus lindianensis TaxID=1630542 RepID=A0ABU3X7L9_9BACI|nr:hypothetical protein [Alkalihalophilus lindianensis]MDV2683803.1 hypothetical protein [Alkalihalophilus lindianensis]MDV2683869.1 hypothetical protein [Alkalihalophilus lindianensis]
MISMEANIIDVLEEDQELAVLLEVTSEWWKIHRYYVPGGHSEAYPYIRVIELDNADVHFANNSATASSIPVQIDLWTKGDPAPLQRKIDEVMKSLGYGRSGVASFFDEENKVIRKALRYNNVFEL